VACRSPPASLQELDRVPRVSQFRQETQVMNDTDIEEIERKTPVEVRQGDRHRTNLRVLVISSAAIVVIFVVVYMMGYSIWA
jgi:hypothetical protein